MLFSVISRYGEVKKPAYIFKLNNIAKQNRVNEKITAPTVRLIGDDGEQLGIMSRDKALELAKSKQLDLLEVAPQVNPPVCKIMDYGKFQYKQKKIDANHRKMQKQREVKGVRIGFRTGTHDVEIKIKMARRFLEDRNSVKISLVFKGREAMYADLAKTKMLQFAEALQDIATMEEPPKSQGNTLFMLLTPNK